MWLAAELRPVFATQLARQAARADARSRLHADLAGSHHGWTLAVAGDMATVAVLWRMLLRMATVM
jgi:hypothetical protein